MRFAKIVILILNWNGKKDTLECLASLEKANQKTKFATVVIDNGSTDDSVASIRSSFPEVAIVENGENLGFAEGNNRGIRWALEKSFEWILLLNNDTVVAPDFIDEFMKAAKKCEGKIFGAKVYQYSDPDRIDHFGGYWNPKIAEFESFAQGKLDGAAFSEMQEVDYVSGCALLMHRSVPETIGLLEKSFFLLWEESDFCFRAKKAGFSIWTAPQAKIWHKVSASFIGGKPHMQYFWWRNRLLFISRNFSLSEKRALYRSLLLSEIMKFFKLALLKSLQSLFTKKSDSKRLEKARRYRAGSLGIIHFFFGRFGNCPKSLCQRR